MIESCQHTHMIYKPSGLFLDVVSQLSKVRSAGLLQG